ncbi:hypothetical protein J4Q44_G00183350 [Coregonus suidteri]|uniref:C2H2-type domain-containing protein n=1 Tax=Coregonus suidteri TaxID=861788 RepID=A0AAN8QNW2_9TELE
MVDFRMNLPVNYDDEPSVAAFPVPQKFMVSGKMEVTLVSSLKATTMSSYTCISCRVAFADGEVQRAHYKTDWHRYNLKRKVADMPPVTAENFQERVLAQRATAEQQETGATVSEGCATCNKKFSSSNAYQNHLQSHKHQQAGEAGLAGSPEESGEDE